MLKRKRYVMTFKCISKDILNVAFFSVTVNTILQKSANAIPRNCKADDSAFWIFQSSYFGYDF